MSEANILNPTAASEVNPDYAWSAGLPQMHSKFQAKSGQVIGRQLLSRGRVYDVAWNSRPKTIADQLRQWEAQYRNDFFTFQDLERGRYFSGQFVAPLLESPAANNKWNLRGQFIEIPGLAMFSYPTAWATDAIFMEERDGFGKDLVKLVGTWVYRADPLGQHGVACYVSSTINDTAEWLYFGYGFRFWAPTAPDRGKVDVALDRTLVATVDQYTAGSVGSAVLLTDANVSLGLHRVKCTVKAKNVASSANNVLIDA